jgi:hypothetical protein
MKLVKFLIWFIFKPKSIKTIPHEFATKRQIPVEVIRNQQTIKLNYD